MNRRPQPKGWSIRSHQPQADAADVVWRIENTCVVERFPEWSCRWRQEGLNGEQEPPHHCFKTPPKILTAAICNPKKVMKCSKSGRSSESSTSILGFLAVYFPGCMFVEANTQPASTKNIMLFPDVGRKNQRLDHNFGVKNQDTTRQLSVHFCKSTYRIL